MTINLDTVWLDRGAHRHGDGGCLMEWTALFAGLAKTDRPRCTNEVITLVAQKFNDRLGDADRQRLKVLIPRLTAAKRSSKDQRVNVRLAVWAARRLMHLAPERDRSAVEAAIAAAEGWLDGTVTSEECRKAAKAAYAAAEAVYAAANTTPRGGAKAAFADANAAIAAAKAADAARAYAEADSARAYADVAYADAAYADAIAVVAAAAYYAYAATAADDDVLIAFFDELLDAHQKALAEEGVLWEPDFCAFADEMSGA